MKRSHKLLAILRVPRYRAALARGRVAASVEHAEALEALTLRTVVDVGANRGQFALFALHTYPDANVISFEPLAGPAALFRRVLSGEPRVTLHHAALGPDSGQTTMNVSNHDDSSSLLPITAVQEQLFKGTGAVAMETVRIGRLSEFVALSDIRAPAMLKMDVQGYEMEALRASDDLLDAFDFVCAEGSFVELYGGQVLAEELVSHLGSRGLSLVLVYGAVHDDAGRAIQADMLFERLGDARRQLDDPRPQTAAARLTELRASRDGR